LVRYGGWLTDLHDAIASTQGASLVVDSSKSAVDAVVMAGSTSEEVFFVHLVRDPRGVAFSWQRPKREHGSADSRVMRRRPAWLSSLRWLVRNASAEFVGRLVPAGRWMRVRYEDFAREPERVVRDILAMLAVDEALNPVVGDRVVVAQESHMAWGNPARRAGGPILIRPDERWRTEMKPRDRAGATLMALPLLRRYGY
jgi:hypothetical protein